MFMSGNEQQPETDVSGQREVLHIVRHAHPVFVSEVQPDRETRMLSDTRLLALKAGTATRAIRSATNTIFFFMYNSFEGAGERSIVPQYPTFIFQYLHLLPYYFFSGKEQKH
jgi:hypothetical protein